MEKKKVIKKVKEEDSKEGLGISGFTLGILSVVLSYTVVLGIFSSITGFVLCLVQQKKVPMKLARIGIILNIIGFVLSIGVLVIMLSLAKGLA